MARSRRGAVLGIPTQEKEFSLVAFQLGNYSLWRYGSSQSSVGTRKLCHALQRNKQKI